MEFLAFLSLVGPSLINTYRSIGVLDESSDACPFNNVPSECESLAGCHCGSNSLSVIWGRPLWTLSRNRGYDGCYARDTSFVEIVSSI